MVRARLRRKPVARTSGCLPRTGQAADRNDFEVTGDAIEGYGKASVVGMDRELEHAKALTHSLWFNN